MSMLKVHDQALPAHSERIGTLRFLELTGLTEDALAELMRMDWIVPARTAQQECLFVHLDVPRVRKYLRLCADFELSRWPVSSLSISWSVSSNLKSGCASSRTGFDGADPHGGFIWI